MNQSNPSITFTGAQLKTLALGQGDADVIDILRHGQYNKFLMTLATINQSDSQPKIAKAMELLAQAQHSDPAKYTKALTYPYITLWASAFLARIVGASVDGAVSDHERHFSAIAAVVAWKSAVGDFEIETTLLDGGVVLPSLGRALLAGSNGDRAVISNIAGTFQVATQHQRVTVPSDPHVDDDHWQGIRQIVVSGQQGLDLRISLDDLDPYRHYFDSATLASPARRLDDVELKTWREVVSNAWELLTEYHAPYAAGVAAGLQVLVPLFDEAGVRRHDHHEDAFGAIALTRPPSSFWLAQSILEEFQRMKLSALHYLSSLHTAIPGDHRYEVPWIELPMPLSRVLEGLYALPLVTEFWATQVDIAHDDKARAEAQLDFVRWRSWVDGVRHRIVRSGELTELGRSFLAEIPTADSLPPVNNIPLAIREMARRSQTDHSLCWRLQNLVPSEAAIKHLATIWATGSLCPSMVSIPLGSLVEAGEQPVTGWSTRYRLELIALCDPSQYAQLQTSQSYRDVVEPTATDVDLMLVEGRIVDAIEKSCELLSQDPDDLDAWAALAIACARESGPYAHTLGRFPEILRAFHAVIVQLHAENVDPRLLATWLAPLLVRMDNEAFETDDPYEFGRNGS